MVLTNLATSGDSTDRTAYTTASITPGNNMLLLLWVYTIAATLPNVPTASGNSLPWSQVATITDSSVRRLTLFRALSATPLPGAITMDFGGQTQTGAAWSVVQCGGVDVSGTNGDGAVVQSASNASASSVGSLTVTLGQPSQSTNAVLACFGSPLNLAFTPGMGCTQIGSRHQATPNLGIISEWCPGGAATISAAWSPSSAPATGIALEVAANTATQATAGFMAFF